MEFKSVRVDITPEGPVYIIGFPSRVESRGINSRLELNIMVWRDGDIILFMIGIDTLFITAPILKSTAEMFRSIYGHVPDDQIILIATHTHFAPAIENNRPQLGGANQEYEAFLMQSINAGVTELSKKDFTEIELKWQSGNSNNLTSSRRRRVRSLKKIFTPFIAMEPESAGVKHEVMDVLRIQSKIDESTLGMVWSFPCHPTNLFERDLISSEFPGAARDAMRSDCSNSEMAIVYLPGLAGDVRAAPITPPNFYVRWCNWAGWSYPKSYYRFQNTEQYKQWSGNVVSQLRKICHTPTQTINTQNFQVKLDAYSLSDFLGLQSETISDISFRKIRFGEDLSMVFISAEVVSAYYEKLRPHLDEKFCFLTGYADEVFGYLPTESQIKEGGYESAGYFGRFGIQKKFKPDIENSLRNAIEKLKR